MVDDGLGLVGSRLRFRGCKSNHPQEHHRTVSINQEDARDRWYCKNVANSTLPCSSRIFA